MNPQSLLSMPTYLDMFFDTGLYAEPIIRSRYEQMAKELHDTIYASMLDKLSQEVLPYSPLLDERRNTVIHVQSRRISIDYSEDSVMLTRYIHQIEIQYQR